MAHRLLIVDDDPSIVKVVRAYLEQAGYDVLTAADGDRALQIVRHERPDLVVLDVMLPQRDGWEITRSIRADPMVAATPIILLTARVEHTDKILGLEFGADDYITKPFKVVELQARVEAILRRVDGQHERLAPPVVDVADLHIDKPRHIITLNGTPMNLTPMEFELLYFLAANAGQVFDRETLFREVWGYEYIGETNLVDVCVRRLREKIEVEPSKPRRIVTVRGVGYKLSDDGV